MKLKPALYIISSFVVNAFCYGQEAKQVIPPADTAGIIDAINDATGYMESAPTESFKTYKRSLAISGQLHFVKGEVWAYRAIGAYYSIRSNYDSCMYYYKKALQLSEAKLGNSEETETLYNNIGSVYTQFGNYKQATTYYYKALMSAEKTGNIVSKVQAYCNLSEIFETTGDYDKGISHLDDAIRIAPLDRASRTMLAILYINKADLLKAKGKYEAAVATIKKAQAANIKGPYYHRSMINSFIMLGDIYTVQKEYKEAFYNYDTAIVLSKKLKLNNELAISYKGLGILNKNLGDKEQAITDFNIALAAALNQQADAELVRIHNLLADLYMEDHQYREASTHYHTAYALNDSLAKVNSNMQLKSLEWEYEDVKKDNELIKKELLITQQNASLQKRNLVIYFISGLSIAFIGIVVIYFRNRRKTERQQEERARWQATLEGEEGERKRLAKELHDNIGGTLSTVKMWFQTIAEREPLNHTQKEYTDALQLLDTALTEVRNTAHHLMPELLLRHGLAAAVRIFCGNVQKATGMEIDYRYLGYIGEIDKGIALIIYRTVQELVQNIVKHAKATHVLVQLSMHENELSLTVEDNGKGTDVSLLPETDGMGLRSIRNNVEKLGGAFQIQAEPGGGTTVDIDIKLKEALV